MEKDLQSYVKVYKNFVERDFCKETVRQLKTIPFQQHTFYNVNDDTYRSFDKELSVSNEYIPNKTILMQFIWNSVAKYVTELQFPWYTGWAGHSMVRFNKYDKNTQMAEHCDHIHSLFEGPARGIPVLSIVGTLNDNYQGGEFIMFQDTEIELKTGDIMIFPSVFLYPHRVNEVTKGTRHSYVSWVW